ncbi:MAG: hypothetical protein AAB481_02785 [Patescibacteria group bacterium]
MDYYHNLVTEKSWKELQNLRRRLDFTLIGGWATYIYAKTLKSKDIDIIVDYDTLPVLTKLYDLSKNDRLKKYQAANDEVEIDIYLPHYSKIGIPVEDLMGKTRVVEGFTVVDPDYLCALKLYVLGERGRTPKGRKDFLDILSLFLSSLIDAAVVSALITRYHLEASRDILVDFLSESQEIPELALSTHRYAKVKREIVEAVSPSRFFS